MTTTSSPLPHGLDAKTVGKRALQVVALLIVIGLVALLTPGLGELRDYLKDADWRWIALAVVLEGLSGMSYVLMFRPIFCRKMSARSAMEISWSELGMGSIVPASGAGGMALGAWVLSRDGMNPERIARRSVAFLLIKSSVNFVAVAVVGIVMFAGVGPHESPWLTIFGSAMSILFILAVASIPRFGPGEDPGEDAGKFARGWSATRRALISGIADAGEILRRGDPRVIAGTIGYWAFDNAVLWATFKAVGFSPPVLVVLMGYLIGQLGGALPIPGGIGGIDGGLIGTLIVYGTPAQATAAAVLIYRVILFWLPLIFGAVAFASLRKHIDNPGRPDLCADPGVGQPIAAGR